MRKFARHIPKSSFYTACFFFAIGVAVFWTAVSYVAWHLLNLVWGQS